MTKISTMNINIHICLIPSSVIVVTLIVLRYEACLNVGLVVVWLILINSLVLHEMLAVMI